MSEEKKRICIESRSTEGPIFSNAFWRWSRYNGDAEDFHLIHGDEVELFIMPVPKNWRNMTVAEISATVRTKLRSHEVPENIIRDFIKEELEALNGLMWGGLLGGVATGHALVGD